MHGLPYRRLAGFYFFYFAYLGAFAPFFSLYLKSLGISPVEIGVLMSLPQLSRIVAPHVWGWLADRGTGRLRVARLAGVAGTLSFLGVFAGSGFALLFTVLLTMTFFWSAALPLVEATTLSHLGEHTARYGRIRVWGSIGFIVAVVAIGYVLDWVPVRVLLWIIVALMAGMLAFCWQIPEATVPPHATDRQPIWDIVKKPEVIALITACALMAAAHGPYYTFYTIHVVNHGYSKALTGWLWALGVICEIGIFIWMPHLYRAFTLRRILIASFALAVVRFLIIGWAVDSVPLLLFAQTLHAATFRLISRRGDRRHPQDVPRPAPGARPGDLRQPCLRPGRDAGRTGQRLRLGAAGRRDDVLAGGGVRVRRDDDCVVETAPWTNEATNTSPNPPCSASGRLCNNPKFP